MFLIHRKRQPYTESGTYEQAITYGLKEKTGPEIIILPF